MTCTGAITLLVTLASGLSVPPDGFIRESIGEGWSNPVGVVERFDGHHVVWEREGRIWLVEPDGDVQDEPWLDISDEVGAWRDHGLLGFALHPVFEQTGWIYVYYVVDRHHLLHAGTPTYDPEQDEYFSATIGRVVRYTANAADGFKSLVPDSRHVLIGETAQTGVPILHESHGVGSLVFGQDGTLLLSMGDSATYTQVDIGGPFEGGYIETALEDGILGQHEDVGAYRAQLIDSLCGKILRIDPLTGDGVSSNPWFDAKNPRSARSRVWTLGLRNPFRFTLIPETGSHDPDAGDPGSILIGDVGWFMKEEVSLVETGGLNAGWPIYEGFDRTLGYADLAPPANRSAPNPLADGETCEQYFNFGNLLLQDTQEPDPRFLNPCSVLEAEDAIHSGPLLSSEEHGYLGVGYLDFQDNDDEFIRWTISVAKAGTYELNFRYARGSKDSQPLRLEVDGATVIESVDFPWTGTYGEWRMLPVTVDLEAGVRTVSLHSIGFSGANIDCLIVDDGTPGSIVEVPEDIPVFLHHRPLFDSQHKQILSNAPIYLNGAAAHVPMGSSDSPISGGPFAGFCSIGGPVLGNAHDDEGLMHDDWPDQWAGAFFADFQYRYIRVMQFDESGAVSAIRKFEVNVGWIVALGRSIEGDALFAVTWNGDVFRYEWAPEGNQSPDAQFQSSVTYGPSPLTVTLDASASSDPEGAELVYTWDFGDGSRVENGMIVEHVFSEDSGEPRPFNVFLTVEDPDGGTDTAHGIISLNNTPPLVEIISPIDGSLYSMSEVSEVDLEAFIVDLEHHRDDLVCSWTTILHHNKHIHSEPSDPACLTSARITPLGCGIETYWYEFELQVTDPAGLVTTVWSEVFPDCAGQLECPADFNDDGIVDGEDITMLLGYWETPNADIDGDGITDGQDLSILLGEWGPCTTP